MFKHEILSSEIARKVSCRAQPEYSKITTPDGQHSCILIEKYLADAKRIKNFEVYEDDIWVVSFPKTGTTWTQEMVWLIVNDLNYEKAKSIIQDERFPFFELSSAVEREFPFNSLTKVKNSARPRFIKTHLPKAFLPDQLWTKKPKIIYVTRNPKDMAVSYFHHYRHLQGYFGSKEDFYEALIQDSISWCPFFPHVLEFWKIRNEKNVFYVNYEAMKRDLRSVIIRMAEFLEKSLTSAQIDELVEFLSFDSMKKNKATNKEWQVEQNKPLNDEFYVHLNQKPPSNQNENFEFLRQGKSRAFETEMSPEWNAKFDKWIEKSLEGTDLKFEY